eukprot:CAMPEP_0206205838 /NCGR_PEP_ID=MMETSP0166-20121206/14499_1 /ASSEMBLY_ACC=CAM_ASM_000260 /TAXON_ID=95228 /ORGANISM="Vannella robusta, Strain DIVA3 518/3/11/1/6" /LENGTH=144 /DNA_ID=CAMNT_0053626015 /DNA_START=1 /DNA_END=435 /DNA_ORIENTATION=+
MDKAFFRTKGQPIMQPNEMVHFYSIQHQTKPFFRSMYHIFIRTHGYFFFPSVWLLYKVYNMEAVRNPPEQAKNDSRYYFLSRIIYAVRYQDAELMAKLEHHPKRVDVVWERMKLKYDFERQHNPVLPSHQQWWFEYKKTHPKFS